MTLYAASLLVLSSMIGVAPAAAACSPRTQASLGPTPAETGVETVATPAECNYSRTIEFPVLANAQFLSSFGVPRDGGERWHAGVDISAPHMTPVVAVKDGVITTLHREGDDCCWVAITHEDRWVSMYVHLTNDHPGTSDGNWAGIRPDLDEGDTVLAGEVIGWVGDSGNAEGGETHLHFELRTPGGEAVDPYPSLRAAHARSPLSFVDPAGSTPAADGVIAQGRPVFVGAFVDDDEIAGASATFEQLLTLDAQAWCDPWGIRVCPTSIAAGATARSWIRTLSQPVEPLRVEFEQVISDLDQRGLDAYCGVATLCQDVPVTWNQVAALLVSAGTGETVAPDAGFERLGAQLGACGTRLDPTAQPTRLELAGALLRWFGYSAPVPCGSVS